MSERVKLTICTNCGKPSRPESCHCATSDFEEGKPIYEVRGFIPREAIEKEVEWLRTRSANRGAHEAAAFWEAADRLSALLSDTKEGSDGR